MWYHGNYGLLNEKLHAVLCSRACPGEKIIEAIDQVAQSGKFDPWLKKVDADIDAGRVKPLNVWRQARSAASLACYQAI